MANTRAAAHEPPFALDGTVTAAKLQELLAVQAELTWLDYKSECDISSAEGLVEITKDIGALMIKGGYILVGVDNYGAPVGLSERQAKLFDQATLSDKLAKYLTGAFEVRSGVHDLDDGSGGGSKRAVIIWVAPHPDGWCIFACDGKYMKNGRENITFRQGDVYTRHGTRSERWNQEDMAHVRKLLVAREKENWRIEIAAELQRATQAVSAQTAVMNGPAAGFSWQIDAAAFEEAAVELIRRDDDVPVRRMLRVAQADASALGYAANGGDLVTLLDRITTLAALGLELRRRQFFEMAMPFFLELYESRLTSRVSQAAPALPAQQVWLEIAQRLYGLGALAVRLSDWRAVRALAVSPVPSLAERSRQRTWHRHVVAEVANSGLLEESTPSGQTRVLSLLLFARAAAVNNSALHPDLPSQTESAFARDRLLISLCQFDLLVMVVSGVSVNAASDRELLAVSYPNFAQFDDERVGSIVRPLITHTSEREKLVPEASDEQIAMVLYFADEVARRAGGQYLSGWTGYHDAVITEFTREQVRQSDQELFL